MSFSKNTKGIFAENNRAGRDNKHEKAVDSGLNNESESSPGRTGKRNGDYDLSV